MLKNQLPQSMSSMRFSTMNYLPRRPLRLPQRVAAVVELPLLE
jgi:hypothetical protein